MPPLGSKFFQFHEVFGKIWQNRILAPPRELALLASWKSWIRHCWYLIAFILILESRDTLIMYYINIQGKWTIMWWEDSLNLFNRPNLFCVNYNLLFNLFLQVQRRRWIRIEIVPALWSLEETVTVALYEAGTRNVTCAPLLTDLMVYVNHLMQIVAPQTVIIVWVPLLVSDS